jgi:hypothetical protein
MRTPSGALTGCLQGRLHPELRDFLIALVLRHIMEDLPWQPPAQEPDQQAWCTFEIGPLALLVAEVHVDADGLGGAEEAFAMHVNLLLMHARVEIRRRYPELDRAYLVDWTGPHLFVGSTRNG